MVFSTSASAYLHLDEHQEEQAHNSHYHEHDSEGHHHDNESAGADHAHHFNLHVIGDLVDHKSISLTRSMSLASCDYASQLISRTYSPLLPPPNA
jgi:ABC-type Zn2+ transport system substrate-binding protein/surface adhesin